MEIDYSDDIDNKIIINNIDIFNTQHKKNNKKYLPFDFDNIIIIPVTINICLSNDLYNLDFIKYSKYIIDTLNDGFQGKINSKYKTDKFSEKYFSELFGTKKIGCAIYNYINNNTDVGIRFILNSIQFHNKTFEFNFFESNKAERIVKNFINENFFISDYDNLHINIIKFNCSTLGLSTFPWIKYTIHNVSYPMLIFIDYKSIHPDLSNNQYNKSRTIIHEIGHMFGLKHTFYNDFKESHNAYKILLTKKIFKKIFTNKKQLYPDIVPQKNPTLSNPIEKKKFIFNQEQDYPVNFCCFMDYSPDDLLTHFTHSQSLIMRNIINIYKPKFIKNYFRFISSIIQLNNRFYLCLPDGYTLNYQDNQIKLLRSEQKYIYVAQLSNSTTDIIINKVDKNETIDDIDDIHYLITNIIKFE